MYYIYLLGVNEKVYIMANNEPPHNVVGFEDEKSALEYFEVPYHQAHTISHEKSMSATMHFMFYNPRLIKVESLDELKKLSTEPPELFKLNHVSGFMFGILCNHSATEFYDNGKVPALVSDEQEQQLAEMEKELMKNGPEENVNSRD